MGKKTEAQILKLLEREEGGGLSESAVMKELGLPEKKRKSLREALGRMTKSGTVKKTRKGNYRAAAEKGGDGEAGGGKRTRSGSPSGRNGEKASGNGLGDKSAVRLLASVGRTADGYAALPRNSDLPDLAIENGEDGSLSPRDLVVVELRRGKSSARVVERLGVSG